MASFAIIPWSDSIEVWKMIPLDWEEKGKRGNKLPCEFRENWEHPDFGWSVAPVLSHFCGNVSSLLWFFHLYPILSALFLILSSFDSFITAVFLSSLFWICNAFPVCVDRYHCPTCFTPCSVNDIYRCVILDSADVYLINWYKRPM